MPTNNDGTTAGSAMVGTTNYVYHSDGTVTSELKNCTQKDKNYTYNPCSGLNFTNADDVCYTVDNKKELYLYQQFYYNSYGYILFYSANKNCGAYIHGNNLYWHTKLTDHDNVASVSDGLHTFKMHVITDTDTTKNVMQIWLDGTLIYDGNNVSYLNGEPITGVEFFSGADNRNSNIIISESDITADDVTKLFPAESVTATNHYDIASAAYSAEAEHADIARTTSCTTKVGLVFDGKTSSLQLPLSVSAGKKVWTISTTLTTNQNTSSPYNYHQPCLIGIDTAGYYSDDFHIDTSNGNLYLFNGMGSSDTGTDTKIKINDELKHNIVLTSDGTKFVLYCDGVKATESVITKALHSSYPITIGCSKPGEQVYSQLTLYDFKFYDVCLANGTATTEKPIVDYEPDITDVANKYLTDKSGNGNNSQAFSGTITSVDASIDASAITTINNYDIARIVSNADYKYYRWETLGDGSQFDVHDSYTTSNDAKYSKTGIAFNAGDNNTLQKNLPNLNEVWLKFDYYNGGRWRWVQVFFNDNTNIGMHGTDDATFFNFFGHEFAGIDGINTVLMHISKTTNTAELWINGTKVISGIGANLTAPITKVSMSPSGCGSNYASNTDNWMSNIIISEKEIGLNENAITATNTISHADIYKTISTVETEHTDISRMAITKDTIISVIKHCDTSRTTALAEIEHADISRTVAYARIVVTIHNDISRAIANGIPAVSHGDIKRYINAEITNHEDTSLTSYYAEFKHADVSKSVSTIENEYADIKRMIFDDSNIPVTVHTDIDRRTSGLLSNHVDICRAIKNHIRTHNDFVVDKARTDRFQYTTNNDFAVKKSVIAKYHYDVAINKLMEIKSFMARYQEVQSISINLNELTLSDSIKLTTTMRLFLSEVVRGKLLDYNFQYAIESTSQKGIQTEAQLMLDCDAILYQPIVYNDEETREHTYDYDESDMAGLTIREQQLARKSYQEDLLREQWKWKQARKDRSWALSNMQRIASSLDKQLVWLADNYMSSNDWIGAGQTFSSIISALWGWTTRVPRRQVNVFIRNDKLYVLQRGHETQLVDITNSAHTVPEIDSEIVRTAWTRTAEDDDASNAQGEGDNLGFEHYFSGTKTNKGMSYEYADGLLTQAQGTDDQGNYTWIIYDYRQIGVYGDDAVQMTYKCEQTQGKGESTVAETYYSYASGWCTATKYVDGEYADSSEYQQSEVARVTEFSGAVNLGNAGGSKRKASLMVDRSFPVRKDDVATLEKLTQELQWMNRKTKETVKMDIYHCDHFIDFTDRLKFDGNEYFLVSNDVSQTQTELKQTVTMVRWY